MKVVLCDTNETVCRLWRQLLQGLSPYSARIHHGELCEAMKELESGQKERDTDNGAPGTKAVGNCSIAIVSPGNSFGFLGGGFDLGIRDYFGGVPFEGWLREALHCSYSPVGSVKAIDVTSYSRNLRNNVKYVVYTPTVVAPCRSLFEASRAVRTGYEPVFNATWSALTGTPKDVETLVMPGMCTGYVGVPASVSCKSMAFALKLYLLENDVSEELKNVLIMCFLGYPFKPFWAKECMKECELLGIEWEDLDKFDVKVDDIDRLLPFNRPCPTV
ncbi:hypothetical protein HG535_0D03350 [Zygotorulaspora mrakii]|uniref:Macro domain-containing protein n=1 Tax=Zygotorulaspora mrakii TaxID=42260 RepID=A0A7H9B2B0_ZYGMR|nr:uncharacterized protein HG535_0D03350 [Zygotorulaspora mrakii]QLG72627.1 hypothetical protein HG535_0D03350 [Zygotorulaspora mrakii]